MTIWGYSSNKTHKRVTSHVNPVRRRYRLYRELTSSKVWDTNKEMMMHAEHRSLLQKKKRRKKSINFYLSLSQKSKDCKKLSCGCLLTSNLFYASESVCFLNQTAKLTSHMTAMTINNWTNHRISHSLLPYFKRGWTCTHHFGCLIVIVKQGIWKQCGIPLLNQSMISSVSLPSWGWILSRDVTQRANTWRRVGV